MRNIPAEVKTDFKLFQPTQFADVLKPVFGSLDNLHCEFRVHQEHHEGDSRKAGKEVKREKEVLLVQTDRFSRVPLAVGSAGHYEVDKDGKEVLVGFVASEMTQEMQMKTAELYERFRSQKASTDTLIFDWEAISDMEKGLLAQSGIYTVEQLFATPEHQRFKLGPAHKDLWERAARHVKSKKENDVNETKREMELVLEENRRIREKQEETERRYFEMQSKIAEMEKQTERRKPGRRPKNSVEEEQLKTAA